MTIDRAFPLACVLWLVALFTGAPFAAQSSPANSRQKGHSEVPLFTTSEDCVACHNNLMSADGEDVSIGSTWRSTMMGNAGRDPYWQAGVRRETIDHPSASEDIQDECATCHMPMLQKTARAAGRKANVFANLPIANGDESEAHRLASDGVSCTVCHQVSNEKLGTRESFNGGFVLQPTPAGGIRKLFGPFSIDAGRTRIMQSVTGFEQLEAQHIRQSELCASCHTLFTQALGPDGRVVGSLPEQMNFQEWQHSAYSDEQRSCQSCHMPVVQGPARISSVLGDPREGLARHLFVGGNFFMVRMLNRYRTDLGVNALPSELEATAKATVRQLEEDTATISIEQATQLADRLTVDVDVRNLAGHKMPTGYPSRRSWLHFTVRDSSGGIVFESGAVTETGVIQGNDNDIDPTKFEPHYDEIRRPDEVQIYEPILGDGGNVPTTGLLQATHYLKDNRLLPRGFDKASADQDIAVHGGAVQDANFIGGSDRVRYLIAIPAGRGPFQIEAELRYQPIGFRWAHNLERYDAPEPRRFVSFFESMASSSSIVLAHATAKVQ
jgi:hypothetical protein